MENPCFRRCIYRLYIHVEMYMQIWFWCKISIWIINHLDKKKSSSSQSEMQSCNKANSFPGIYIVRSWVPVLKYYILLVQWITIEKSSKTTFLCDPLHMLWFSGFICGMVCMKELFNIYLWPCNTRILERMQGVAKKSSWNGPINQTICFSEPTS